jgi:hypothetical protein
MDDVQANDEVVCCECGAPLPKKARFCWLCGASLDASVRATQSTASPFRPLAPQQFSLATLMLVMTFAAVLVGVFSLSPGAGLAVMFLAAPAFVRTCVVATRRKSTGQRMSWGSKLGVFLASLGIVVAVVAASIAAFFAVCFTVVR